MAHEFVHVIQFQRRVDRSLNRVAATKTALLEGSAVFVTDRYARKYGLTYPGDQLPIERWVQEYPTLPPWHGTLGGQYHFGAQYVDRRIDDATEVWSVYDDPPETMEQVIHGDDAGPERSLSLAPLAPGWTVTYKGARGEHEVRAIMRGVLDGEEAAVAAAGWGSDELLEFAPKDGDEDVVGHVWVLRWDDASAADECADALRKVARARAAVVDASFQVVRAAPETVVLLTGPTGFVNEVTVSGTNERVTIAIEAPMR